MKLIISAWGAVFIHASADDVIPKDGVNQQDLIQYLTRTYKFASRPITAALPVQATQNQNLVFRSGKLTKGDQGYVIHNLVAFPNGDGVVGFTTESAEIVMNDYLDRLDADLKYRYKDGIWKRTYASGVVIEFEFSLEERIPTFKAISAILDRTISREGRPFKPKSISFGDGDPLAVDLQNDIDAASKTDFTLQRRAGEPYSANRYYSVAPIKTQDHVKMLEEIEAVLGK